MLCIFGKIPLVKLAEKCFLLVHSGHYYIEDARVVVGVDKVMGVVGGGTTTVEGSGDRLWREGGHVGIGGREAGACESLLHMILIFVFFVDHLL